jgi:hypothetical protein
VTRLSDGAATLVPTIAAFIILDERGQRREVCQVAQSELLEKGRRRDEEATVVEAINRS